MVKLLNSVVIYAFIIGVFISCKNSNKITSNNIGFKKDSTQINNNGIKKQHDKLEYDVLAFDSLLLRKRNLTYTRKELKKIWKQPDSTYKYIAGCSSIPSDSLTMYYYKGVTFAVYDDSAELESISFPLSNETITHPLIKLNKETQLDFFKAHFQNSYRGREEYYENDRLYSTLRFKTHKEWDDIIILLFIDKKLIGLSFWSPC